jgi:hypothetical protein
MSLLEEEVTKRLKAVLQGNPYWHTAYSHSRCVPTQVPGFESILMCPFRDCSPYIDVKTEPLGLEKELRDGAVELIKLADDLKAGRAKEVPPSFGHVYQHIWKEEATESVKGLDGKEIQMIKREACTDFLKLWGVWYYVATCPRTGLRFVEGIKK